jgi:hypothetical protein
LPCRASGGGSSAGQSSGLIIRRSWVRAPPAPQVRQARQCSRDTTARGTLLGMSEGSLSFDAEVADHQVILRAGQVEAVVVPLVVVPLEEYRALKALEQREAELYWAAQEDRYPSRPGDDVPAGKVYDSMEDLVADLGAGE